MRACRKRVPKSRAATEKAHLTRAVLVCGTIRLRKSEDMVEYLVSDVSALRTVLRSKECQFENKLVIIIKLIWYVIVKLKFLKSD